MARRSRQRDDAVAAALGTAAGLVVVASGARPTGAIAVDVVLTVGGAAFVAWSAARLPWWTTALVAAAAVGLSDSVWGAGAGVVALAFALVGRQHLMRTVTARSASVAAVLVSLAHLRDLAWWGTSAVLSGALTGALIAAGLASRRSDERRLGVLVLATGAGVVAVGTLGLAIAGVDASGDLRAGDDAAHRGLALVRSGEFQAARAEFAIAAARFREADLDLRAPWAQLSRLVPVVAQHRTAGSDVSHAAAAASRTIEAELRSVDLEALRVVDGRIDLEAVRSLDDPLRRVTDAVRHLDSVIAAADGGWLVGRVRDRFDRLRSDLGDQLRLGRQAGDALAVAPDMLGANGVRRYLIMFTTPAEARGHGGFMGNYAELTVDDGRIEMTAFGRHRELSRAADGAARLEDAPADWLALYGPFGFTTGPTGTVGDAAWANITMSPHFPSTAAVAAELYPKSGGREVDGVVALDVYALEAIVGLVGPIDVDGAPVELDGMNTASFLLVDQYRIADIGTRVDLLETVARHVVDRLLGGAAPAPLEIGRALRPMVEQGRLTAWSPHDAEQHVLVDAGMDGSLLGTRSADAHGVAIRVNNASGNKMDTFLTRDYDLRATPNGGVELTIVLRNDPPLGLPDYVVGNLVGLPRGWSRLFLTVHTDLELLAAEDAAGPLGLQRSQEAGTAAYSSFVEIAPGGTATWRLALDGNPDSEFLIEPQPLVTTERWSGRLLGSEVVTTLAGRDSADVDGR